MSHEGNNNDKAVWRAWEEAVTEGIHLMNVKEISQAQWASTQLKPKHTTPRFGKLLLQRAFD